MMWNSVKLMSIFFIQAALYGVVFSVQENHQHFMDDNRMASHNPYGGLSDEEIAERLKKYFTKIDTNGDGFLDADEVAIWLKKSLQNTEVKDTKHMMNMTDTNKDGKMSFTEYLESNHGHPTVEKIAESLKDHPDAKDILEQIADDKARFEAADLDNDNLLTEDELRAFLHPYSFSHMGKTEVKSVLNRMDTDKDGRISLDEYTKSGNDETGFKNVDLNKDGYLSDDEIIRWVSPDPDVLAKSEFDYLLERSDTNKDGKLSSEEMLSDKEFWADRESTLFSLHDEL